MSDLSNLLGSVYDSQNADRRAVPQEGPADQRTDAAPAPAPMPAPAPAYAPPPQPLDHFVPGDQPAYAPVAPAGSWRLGDDDIVPGAVAGKRGKKG